MSISDIHKKNRRQSHIPGLGQGGYTLVELLVTFALFAIFMTAVVMCLPGITKIYMQLQQINHEQTICNTVSNEIKTQLQGILGVEGDGDPLGIKNGNGLGYLALLDERGTQIQLTSESAAASGSAVLPAADISGSGIEFAYMNGIVAQTDTNGFDGYTMRKNKLQMDYHGAHAVSPGALVTRYYEADIEKNTRTTTIDYQAAAGNYSAAAGVSVSDGTQNVAYAIQYPYVPSFYEGFELQTTFTIKKDACYTVGSGTTESPARVYVNYVNYTLSLLKDGQLCYSQDYVVNIQNAVPYWGTKVAEEPEEPDQPVRSPYDAYVVPDSVTRVTEWGEGDQKHGQYTLEFHVPASRDDESLDYFQWKVNFPYVSRLVYAQAQGSAGWIYTSQVDDNNMLVTVKQDGYIPEFVIKIEFQTIGVLTNEQMKDMEDLIHLMPIKDYSNCSAENVNIISHTVSGGGSQYQDFISYSITAPSTKRIRERVEVTYDKNIKSVSSNRDDRLKFKIEGNKLTVYGMLVERNDTLWRDLYVQLEDSSEKPNPGIIKFGK